MPSRHLVDCDVRLAESWRDLLLACERDYPGRAYLVTCTYRSPAEQFELYKVGRRLRDDGSWVEDDDATTKVVTGFDGTRRTSKHNVRPSRALDFAVLIGGKVTWQWAEYHAVGRMATSRGLVWGGDWPRLKDGPHLELPD